MSNVAAKVRVPLVAGVVSTMVMAAVVAGCKKDPPPPPSSPSPAAALAQAAAALEQAGKNMQQGGADKAGGPAGAQQPQMDMAKAMQAMGMALNGGKKVEPVSYKDLKALLPEEVSGFKRKETKGEKNGAMGLSIAEASARYEGEGGASLRIKIVDVGSLSGPMAMGLAGWASLEIDRESDDGYEKTTTFSGRKAVEKYNNGSKHGEIKVLLSNRFIVEVDGHQMKMDDIKAAAGKLDLKKLEGLK
jgi:hypothetical protein